jgi:hypothetical protein
MNRVYHFKKKSDCSILLEKSILSFYVFGFILADGSFSSKRLNVVLSCKDKEHLIMLAGLFKANFNFSRRGSAIGFTSQDPVIIPYFMSEYDIKRNKTYNPPSVDVLSRIPDELLTPMFIGFVDGDGNISKQYKRRDSFLRIKKHSSWLGVLSFFSLKMFGVDYAKINNSGYAELVVSKAEHLRGLKLFAIKHALPVLNRKWSVIDENFVSRMEGYDLKVRRCVDLLSLGVRHSVIHNETGLNESIISLIKKKWKLSQQNCPR